MLHNVSNGCFGEAATQNLASRPKAGQGRFVSSQGEARPNFAKCTNCAVLTFASGPTKARSPSSVQRGDENGPKPPFDAYAFAAVAFSLKQTIALMLVKLPVSERNAHRTFQFSRYPICSESRTINTIELSKTPPKNEARVASAAPSLPHLPTKVSQTCWLLYRATQTHRIRPQTARNSTSQKTGQGSSPSI
jgi:hypothetical protein